MAKLKQFFGNWWVLAASIALFATFVVIILCGLVVAAALPWRWPMVIFVWVLFSAAAVWRILKQRRSESELRAAMTAAADGEASAITAKMSAALDRVKADGKNALYALPWYAIIGPPGAGKTTLIQKSGLQLLNDEAAQGVGGTRNTDWWFTSSAVLIDTAGRYTTQDVNRGQDTKGWKAFLQTLRRARPLQPLNGVLVAVALDEIATASAEQLSQHVVAIRARVSELAQELAMQLPIYVMLTKADLVAGFVEFFDDLSVEGRRAVVGATLPVSQERPTAAALAAAYDDMVQALADRVPARLQSEQDPVRRGAAVTFPARFIELRARIVGLLDGAFGEAAGQAAPPCLLRGFYLTSGVQQGTPIDRLLGELSQSLGRGLRARPTNPRAFFVNRLLQDVVIAEAGIALPDASRARRERLTKIAAMLVAAVSVASLLTLWTISFSKNARAQTETTERAAELKEASSRLDSGNIVVTTAEAAEVLPILDSLRAQLPLGMSAQANRSALQGLGLYRQNLADGSVAAYHDALQRFLLPRLILSAERAIGEAGGDPVGVYEPLKIYLMLGNRAGSKRDDQFILRWLEQYLAARELPGPENAEARARINRHAASLLSDSGRFGRYLSGALLDPAVVEAAQATIASMTPAQRALALMKQRVAGPDWSLVGNALLPGEREAFGNPDELASATIPFLFTKRGFQSGFIPQASTIALALDNDRWMLGSAAAAQSPLNMQELGQAYAAEYAARWMDMLALPSPGDYSRDTAALARIANPAASPLKKIADQAVANTSGLMPTPKSGRSGVQGLAVNLATRGMKASASGVAAAQIEATFQGLRDYALGDAAPLKQLLGALGKYQLALAQASAGGGAGGGGGAASAISGAAAELSVAAANAAAAAPGLSDFVGEVAGGSSRAADSTRGAELLDRYSQAVQPVCQGVLGKGYPFGRGADLQPSAVMQAAGALDSLRAEQLDPFLEKGKVWRWRNDPAVRGFSRSSAGAFQRAGEVGEMLTGDLVLRLAASPGNAGALRLRSGGVPMELSASSAAERFSWSPGGSQVTELAHQGGTIREEGPWSLFRLLDRARRQTLGQGRYRFTFAPAASVDIEIVSGPDPFATTGPFSLRCPTRL